MDAQLSMTRTEMIGPSYWKMSEFGLVQFEHGYDAGLLERIRRRAWALKDELAHNRHLDLNYIRGVHRYIPEVLELLHDARRHSRLEAFAGEPLEPYPIEQVRTLLSFQSADEGSIGWHTDAGGCIELIPLDMDGLSGGEFQVYRGQPDIGRHLESVHGAIPEQEILTVPYRMGCSTFGQFFRVLHRAAPITAGRRVTLMMAMRSVARPFLDDNMPWYLGADNPNFDTWLPAYLDDMRNRQLPAYLEFSKRAASTE